MKVIERRESTCFNDTNGKTIRRWDWVRFVYYDENHFPVSGGEGPVMKHNGEWVVVQICPYEVIFTSLSDISNSAFEYGNMEMGVEGWIDVPDCPHGLWKSLKHTGARPEGSEV